MFVLSWTDTASEQFLQQHCEALDTVFATRSKPISRLPITVFQALCPPRWVYRRAYTEPVYTTCLQRGSDSPSDFTRCEKFARPTPGTNLRVSPFFANSPRETDYYFRTAAKISPRFLRLLRVYGTSRILCAKETRTTPPTIEQIIENQLTRRARSRLNESNRSRSDL